MTVALTLLLVVLGVGIIGYPFFVTRRPRGEDEEASPEAKGPAILGELESDYQAGILSKEEYDELRAGRQGDSGEVAGAAGTAASVDDEIEQRVRVLRASSQTAPAPQREPRAGSPTAKCPKCGQAYRIGDRFCTRCGARLASGGKR